MNIDKSLAKESLKYESYEITLTPLDQNCNSLKVEVRKHELYFEETISIYDFVDIKKLIKAGKTMQQINQFSLLFLKLMISTAVQTKKLAITEAKDIPFEKLIKRKEDMRKWALSGENNEVKGLFLQVREELFVVIPKLLVNPPKIRKSQFPWQPKSPSQPQSNISQDKQKQQKIKSIFFGQSDKRF